MRIHRNCCGLDVHKKIIAACLIREDAAGQSHRKLANVGLQTQGAHCEVPQRCPADTSPRTPDRTWGFSRSQSVRFGTPLASRLRDLTHDCCHAAARSSARMSMPAFRKRAAMSRSVRRDASYSTLIVWAFSSNQVFRTPYTCRTRSSACNSRSPEAIRSRRSPQQVSCVPHRDRP